MARGTAKSNATRLSKQKDPNYGAVVFWEAAAEYKREAMKKFLNKPEDYARETIEGLCLAYPENYMMHPKSWRVVHRPNIKNTKKVGIVTGGGSGHLPVFTGYVGSGLLSACAVGEVFASPPASDMAIAIEAADTGRGVLLVYGNYGGDIMNFNIATELVGEKSIQTVVVADDVASAPINEKEKRRGVAGLVLAFKIAGAASEKGLDLSEVHEKTAKAVNNIRSIGVALSPCIVPQAGKANFTIGPREMEFGMGIHGEPGVLKDKLSSANDVADMMLNAILQDFGPLQSDRVAIIVNSLGATPTEELFIIYKRISEKLKLKNIQITFPMVGRYATSMEMTGVSLTMMTLNDETQELLNAPANCAYWSVNR